MVVMIVLLYLSPAIVSVNAFFRPLRKPQPKKPRPGLYEGIQAIAWQVTMLGLLALTWSEGWWSWAAVTHSNVPIIIAIPVGIAAWGAFALFWRWFDRRQHASRQTSSPRTPTTSFSRDYAQRLHVYWPRSRPARTLIALRLILSPISEELTTRGVLVWMISLKTGSVVLGLLLGATSCTVLHLRDRVKNLIYHLAFFAVTAALLLSVGLVGAVACHVALDLGQALPRHLKRLRQLRAWDVYERRKRAWNLAHAPPSVATPSHLSHQKGS